MNQVKPSSIRNVDIRAITRSGEDHVTVEMASGKFHEISIDELVKDWLFQHKKLRKVGDWAERSKAAGAT